ncbi:ATP-binding cassette domain-containing protein [Mangrovibacterium diazotrophicum]|uniref:ABC-type multidrug transport system ATPase subunit n=1 Tax=Mangrovibacterium diazotrophicum TaxID=1261403 RepID=A0A419VWK8_9BACT|nr:ATP-binding cassette domain-containing protein [Mangrovibacterium diazotrophicum]RKD86547.1 ABC-type multidrug transport system ATPase subunit [Mangrovibacterium diazotrophicum]
MYEGIIETLVKLFAIITDYRNRLSSENMALVESYLKENFNRELVDKYLTMYRDFVTYYHVDHREFFYKDEGEGERFINKKYLTHICTDISFNYDLNVRFMIVTQLFNFINKAKGLNIEDLKMVHIVAMGLNINPKEYDNFYRFALFSISKVKEKSWLFVVNGTEEYEHKEVKHLYRENQKVDIEFIRIPSINTLFFKYTGPRNLYLNGHRLVNQRLYIFPPGGVLKTSRIIPIYYSTVMTRFIQNVGKPMIVFNAEAVEYRFNKRVYGLHELSFQERSGDLVGILGGSGVGKTTLLNVLNGKLKPSGGKITINGYDIHDPENEDKLTGVIGYVPQDDLLLEELTVYQNLRFNALFCFSDADDEKIEQIIEQTLTDFDLVEARDLVVGNPLKKILSGGQRKRLNIALELMREPSMLFVDEPTSGLSSADSEKVMYLLKRQCLKGKLVFANIHQPSSDIYKLFDRIIVMDKGGRVVFFGNPMESITYFKHQANYINPDESECLSCGNVKTEQPLRIIEARMVDPFGKSIRRRKVSPQEWYQSYREKVEPRVIDFMKANPVKKEKFPDVLFKKPKWWTQFKLYLQRDFASKRSNRQYLAIALLEAPILAVILGFFTKFSFQGKYIFSENDNIPAYLFMSVVVALFIGLSISAEEIFKDRKIRKREEFLNLSKGAYFASKIILLFLLSAFQVLTFVLVGNYLLEIKSLTFEMWVILFSTACFANLLGLNLSAGLDSAVAIYVMIPFLLVPQLLLSGVIVDFNKMNYSIASYDHTPLIGDAMVSRWSYEALAVNQYTNNSYRKHFFDQELEKNSWGFATYYFLPELEKLVNAHKSLEEANKTDEADLLKPLLYNSFSQVNSVMHPSDSIFAATQLLQENAADLPYPTLKDYLASAKKRYQKIYNEANDALNAKYELLLQSFKGDSEKLQEFKDKYTNKKLELLLRDKYSQNKIYISQNLIHQGDEPIYRLPFENNGRAHFYAAYKFVGPLKIPTIIFNALFIWLFTALLAVTLYFDVLRKVLTAIQRWRETRQAELRDRIFYNPMAFMKSDRKRKFRQAPTQKTP